MSSAVRPTRVVHVAEAAGGGLMGVLETVCLGHLDDGMDVTVIHGRRPETSDARLEFLRQRGVHVVEIAGWGERSVRSELRAINELQRVVRVADPDLVVLHSSFAGVSGLCLAGTYRTVFAPHAFASQIRGRKSREGAYVAAETLACRVHTATACVSVSEARVARRRGSEDARVIRNGSEALDAPNWPLVPTAPDVPTVVGSGRLVPQRRPIETADILGALSRNAHVRWLGGAGDGDYARRADAALRQAGVDVTGWLPQAQVRQALQQTTVYVHWTNWDGLPLTVLEAMAEDAVVVAADNEPNWEVVGKRGVFRSASAAVAEVRRLLQDPGYWADRVLEQRERASRFSAQRMQREWNAMVYDLSDREPLAAPALAMAA